MLHGKEISIIMAISSGRLIGNNNGLPWPFIREDMKYFQDKTIPHSVIMGRNTWDSIPTRFRPLRDRENIVLSRNSEYALSEPGVTLARTFDAGVQVAKNAQVFAIGGVAVYKEALHHADNLYITEVSGEFEGDVFFPLYNEDDWLLHESSQVIAGNTLLKTVIPIKFTVYKRK